MLITADLDGDGFPEVLLDDIILDGSTGDMLFQLGASLSARYRMAAVADVDMDGDQEIFMAGVAYDSDGSVLWRTGERGTYGFWPIIVQADSDPEAEIGFVGESWTLWDHDGTLIYERDYAGYWGRSQPGPPSVGDFDGDGEAEVAWPSYQNLVMYELDGTEVWSVYIDDTTGIAGCSGFDVNGDGALEILFADQSSFTIFDGATGMELYTNTGHSSDTIHEYPTIADIDNDGSAEIVITSNFWSGSWGVVTAFEHDGAGWPASGSTWATHDFRMTDVNADGSVPAEPEPSWLAHNVYRARVAADDTTMPDLSVAHVDFCVTNCDGGFVKISFQVFNQGGANVEEETAWTLYRNDGGVLTVVTTGTVDPINAGEAPEGIEVVVRVEDAGTDGFVVSVDDEGSLVGIVDECDEDNNTYVYDDSFCE
jgi:hypothetical protein